VRRPGVVEQVEQDLDLLRSTASQVEKRSESARLLQLEALADEVETHLRAELDFREEASNAELVRRLVEDYRSLVVPGVIQPHVTEEVLVLDRIHGEKVSSEHGPAREPAQGLARELFHAYVHQVRERASTTPTRTAGTSFSLPTAGLPCSTSVCSAASTRARGPRSRSSCSRLLRTAPTMRPLSCSSSPRRPPETDEPGFVHELRRKLPRYHWRPLSQIRAGEALADLQRLALQYRIKLPPSFALVGKTLSQADSIARTLDPELDPVELLDQDSLRLMLREAERRVEPNNLLSYLFTQVEPLLRLPQRVGQAVDRLETGTLKVGVTPTGLGELERVIRSAANRVGAAPIVVGLLVSSALMARVDHTVAIVGFALSFVLGLYMLWKIVRTPGEL
jgi:ubiquinone biosynthesis protein